VKATIVGTESIIGEFKSKLFLPKVIGRFVIEDQTFSYWISALNQTIYKTTKILPPLTTVNIRDDGDLGTLQFNNATFNCSEVHEKKHNLSNLYR
jgi:hypothetical protein